MNETSRHAEILIVGGGVGGVAAALAAARRGRPVLIVHDGDWLGGQLTSQAVPPDEHAWIEQFGCTASYRRFREASRDYYRRWYPMAPEVRGRADLNPGLGRVSRLCIEPRAAEAVIEGLLAPWRSAGLVEIVRHRHPVAAETDGDRVTAVIFEDASGGRTVVSCDYVLDATELGDLLPLADVEHVTGFESSSRDGRAERPRGGATAQSAGLLLDLRRGTSRRRGSHDRSPQGV